MAAGERRMGMVDIVCVFIWREGCVLTSVSMALGTVIVPTFWRKKNLLSKRLYVIIIKMNYNLYGWFLGRDHEW